MNLKSTTFFSALYAVIRMATAMISVKVMAWVVGPAGVAYVGQFQSFLKLTHNGANLGIGNGTIKYLAEYRDDEERYSKVLSTSILINFVGSTSLGIIIGLYAKEISRYLFRTASFDFVLMVLALTMVFYSFAQIIAQALNGFQEIKKLIIARIVASIVGLVVTVLLIVWAGIQGALLALVVSQVVGLVVMLGFAYSSHWFSKKNLFAGWDKKIAYKLSGFSLMTFCSIILLNLRQIFLRDYIMVELSTEAAGYWQAIWKISELYLTVITMALSVYYLPKLSEITDKGELKAEIWKGYKFLIPVVAVLSVLIFLLRDIIILVLFTPDFVAIRDLFFYQLIGDVFKIASWILSFLLVAKAMTKTFIITEVIFIGLFMVLALTLVHYYGLIGMTYAFAITYFTYFVTMIVLFRDIIFYRKKSTYTT